eukprot:CAMPEP_0184485504 /NCGR_PEP_ID=MMETSP0113_2-20130426/7097_1 /TAXON_ID=91329 /ORGANISM="Norrisiella sphaerica, Strain BC52" /LENGTH=193 /DNA_ID=CAMNT_0026866965 /DNA_START=8 /DNA_END=589 /DNA_ORIENTATION=-
MEVKNIFDERSGLIGAPKRSRNHRLSFLVEFCIGAVVMLGLIFCYRGIFASEQNSLSLGLARVTSAPLTRTSVSPFVEPSTRNIMWVPEAKLRKRDRQGEKRRIYNKAIKSAVKTRTKKALRSIEEAKKEGISAEGDLQQTDKLMSEAYKEIDKAISKGVMKKNTGARQKSRIATWRKKLLIESGVYTPVETA